VPDGVAPKEVPRSVEDGLRILEQRDVDAHASHHGNRATRPDDPPMATAGTVSKRRLRDRALSSTCHLEDS